MKRVVIHDIDSRIPNLALLKLSAWHRKQGAETFLSKTKSIPDACPLEADIHLGSTVFRNENSAKRIEGLRNLYGDKIEIGGFGVTLAKRLAPEVEEMFPDYRLYNHTLYALGFLTRGCNKRCSFCIVPAKEGRVKLQTASFEDFVPPGQRNVMLLDDNLLSFTGVEDLLKEMIARNYAMNFSQTLDIAYLNDRKFELLRQIDYQSARFQNRMIYFSLNYPATIAKFMERRGMLRAFGKDCVTVVCIYGFDTSLSDDYNRFICLRRLGLIPFFQEYWPIENVPGRLPSNFFDMDLNAIIRLTFRSNGYNWEKYLRWLNQYYFLHFGKYYRPLVSIIYRYNNKPALQKYLLHPQLLTDELYKDFREEQRVPLRRMTLKMDWIGYLREESTAMVQD